MSYTSENTLNHGVGGIESFMAALMLQQRKQGIEVAAIVHADETLTENEHYIWNDCLIFEVKSFGQMFFAPISPGYAFRLLNCLKSFNPDIIHVHMPNLSAFWLLPFVFFRHTRAKIVIQWHADVLGSAPTKAVKLLYPFYAIFEKLLLRKSNAVVATSPPYLSSSVPLKNYRDKCSVIPLGLMQSDDVLHDVVSGKPGLNILIIGRLTYYKGHELLIDALSKIKDKHIKLHIVGTGEMEIKLKALANKLEVQTNITWHGFVSEAEKVNLLRQSDVLCLPSIERTEAFGMVILEAARLGIPALVSDVDGSGMGYVVQDGQTGLLFASQNLDSLIEKLLSVYNEKEKLRQLGDSAKARFRQHFTINGIAERWQELYSSMLKR